MGTDMEGHLEFHRAKIWQSADHGWDFPRDYRMFRLLANVRGEGALFPPRGVPGDLSYFVRQAYYVLVLEDEAPTRNRLSYYTRAEAEANVASGESVPFQYEGRPYISRPILNSASWLTTDEFRQVVEYYDAHGREYWEEELAYLLALPDAEKQRRQRDIAEIERVLPGSEFAAIEWYMILAAMEASEVRGYPARLVFWFIL